MVRRYVRRRNPMRHTRDYAVLPAACR
jgi:hypothetical protein